MNKIIFLAFLILSATCLASTYSVVLDRSGSASVTFSADTDHPITFTVPQDANGFSVMGGAFTLSNGTVMLTPDESGFTTFSFYTGRFTTKTDGNWQMRLSSPPGALTRIYLPPYSAFHTSSPEPLALFSDGSRMVAELPPSDTVSLGYTLNPVPPAPEEASGIYIFGGALLLAAAAVYYVLRMRGESVSREQATPIKEKAPSLELTPGKREMMETFNENDLRIVNLLLSGQGRSRRNELERKSGISKSSLSMALNRLEKRKIIEIDRTSTTHFVKLSDYFLML